MPELKLQKDHLSILLELGDVMTYSIDEKGEEYKKITYGDFFRCLYVPRSEQDELELRRAVLVADSLVVLTAPRGGGKTTFLMKALHDYGNRPKQAFIVCDFKEKAEAFYPLDEKSPFSVLSNIVKRDLMRKFLSSSEHLCDMFVWNALNMFFPFRKRHVVNEARVKFKNPAIDEETVKKAFFESPDLIAEESDYVLRKITVSQMIKVIVKTHSFKSFLLIFDNIDRLEQDILHEYLLSFAVDVYNGGKGSFGVIVAVRDKNIMRYKESGSNGNTITLISLRTQHKESAKLVHLPFSDESLLTSILKQRYEYARTLTEKLCISGTLNGIKPRSLTEFWTWFDALQECISNRFIKERLYNLSNRSIRQLLINNIGFINYLYRLLWSNVLRYDRGTIIGLNRTTCHSYLYRWIFAINNPQHQWIRNILQKYKQPHEDPLEYDIELLILSWLANNESKLTHVYDMKCDFSLIGVTPQVLRDAIWRLYKVNKVAYRYIELGLTEEEYKLEEIVDDTRIKITYLGKEFVTHIITTFEYLLQAILHPVVESEDSPSMLQPILRTDKEFDVVYRELEKIVDIQIKVLNKIRAVLSEHTPRWEEVYKKLFCIEKKSLLERIQTSHISHFHVVAPHNVERYREAYQKLLARLTEETGLEPSTTS